MIKVLANDKIDPQSAKELKEQGFDVNETHLGKDDLKKELKNYDAVIVRSATKLTKDILSSTVDDGKLKLIVRAGVGLDNIDQKFAEENDIAVKNTPAASINAVAELTVAHILALSRNLHQSNVTMREGQWLKKEYQGNEIEGKTLGIIGFGRMGQAAGKKAHALGMKVVYTKRSGPVEGFEDFQFLTKEELLKTSDVITLHMPFNPEVGAVIGTAEFDLMKKGVLVINCARGGVLSEDALLNALDKGIVAGAALDVFEEEPLKTAKIMNHPKISLTPHIGASTEEAQGRIGGEIVKILSSYFKEV